MPNMVTDRDFARQVWEDIGNGEYKYVYFDGIYNDARNMPHKSYEDQQGVMASEWEDKAKKTVMMDNNSAQKAITYFQTLQSKAISTEIDILKKMGYNKSYPNVSSQKIALWTNVFLFNSPEGQRKMWDKTNQRDVDVAFALFINSKEFITLYRSSAIYSTLSSEKYGKAIGKDVSGANKALVREQFVKMLTIPQSAEYRNFRKAIIDSMSDYFLNSGLAERTIEDLVRDALSSTRDYIVDYQDKAARRKYSKNTIYENTKSNLKRNLETMLKDAYKKAAQTNQYDAWKESHFVDGILDSLKITMGDEDKQYIVMEITPETKKENVYKFKKDATVDEKKLSFIEAVEICFDKLVNTSISMGFIKSVDLNKTDFWECVRFFITNELFKVTETIFSDNSTFFNQDWNASAMTGMLGELSAYLTHGGSIGNMSLTGTTADTMIQENDEVIGLGESFKDLTFLFNGKYYGINVKRYTSSEQDRFNLYRDDKGIGINSQYMYRYFNKDEVNLMRFIALNRDFIVEGLSKETEAQADAYIRELFSTLSAYRLDNFIRLSGAQTDIINLFYVINNLTIPASVIYQYIIDTLQDLNVAKSLFDIVINNTPDFKRIDIQHTGNISELPATIENSNNLLRDSIKIKFKGLSLSGLGQIFK